MLQPQNGAIIIPVASPWYKHCVHEIVLSKLIYTLSGNCSDQISSHLQRFQCLSPEDLAVATMVRQKDVLSFLSHSVPCVGCRRRYQNVSISIYYFLVALRLIIDYSKRNLSNVYNWFPIYMVLNSFI